MKISAITPTADRPIAFALCERYVARQIRQPDEWIVADGGMTPTRCTMGQTYIHSPRPPGAANFANNLLNAVHAATGDLVVIIEDDDWYQPHHIECMEKVAEHYPLIGSEPIQTYYNVAHRVYRTFKNVGASMCQTAIRRELVPAFVRMACSHLAREHFGIDTNFWRSIPVDQWGMVGKLTVLGIKGIPGNAGLGIGHRPDGGKKWKDDRDLIQLRHWIGADAEHYAGFAREISSVG